MSDFIKIIVFKNSFRNMIRVSNILHTVCKGNQQTKLELRQRPISETALDGDKRLATIKGLYIPRTDLL